MEKVKLTKEQANAIEWALQKENEYSPDRLLRLRSSDNANFHNELYPLNDIDIAVLARALYIGYEVEPEFKVGDWIHDNITNRVAKIDERGYDGELAWVDDEFHNFFTDFRHATPEEIQQEKERRWWAKHDREVWELRPGDVLVCDDYPRTVNKVVDFEEKTVIFSDKDWEYYENVIEEYEVACFAEDRKDI